MKRNTMSKAITMTENYSLADLLEKNHFAILSQWQGQARVQNVLNAKQISPNFFFKHFGSRVLDYFINILRGKKEPGSCPVIIVMLNFFSKRELLLEDLFQICSGKRNAVIHTLHENGIAHTDNMLVTTIELFDANFSGVIREYTKIISHKHEAISVKKITQEEADQQQITSIKEYMQEEMNIDESVSDTKDQCVVNEALLGKYFATDEDDDEKILFRSDDADEMLEYFSEVSERLALVIIHPDPNEIKKVANIFPKHPLFYFIIRRIWIRWLPAWLNFQQHS